MTSPRRPSISRSSRCLSLWTRRLFPAYHSSILQLERKGAAYLIFARIVLQVGVGWVLFTWLRKRV